MKTWWRAIPTTRRDAGGELWVPAYVKDNNYVESKLVSPSYSKETIDRRCTQMNKPVKHACWINCEIVKADDTVKESSIETGKTEMKQLQEMVGGYFIAIEVWYKGCERHAYVNEDGNAAPGALVNMRASKIMQDGRGLQTSVVYGDMVILMGAGSKRN